MGEMKVCKCCGHTKPVEEFDKCNTGKRISICKVCRRHQQRIANYKHFDVLQMSSRQLSAYNESVEYMTKCCEATGFETGKYSSKVSADPVMPAPGKSTLKTADLRTRYAAAQSRRQQMERMGVEHPAPTADLVTAATVEELVDFGYTSKECFAVLDNVLTADHPDYDAVWDKLILIPT